MDEDLGQHFLTDPAEVERPLAAASPREGERALDIGAGEGALTLPLARAVGTAGRVVAVEVDEAFAARLRERAGANVQVVRGDALQARLPASDVVVANPPFRIAAPLLLRLLEVGFQRALLVVPRELADRLLAPPRSERYGRLTVQVAVRAAVRRLYDLPRGAFTPPPRVRTSVVRVEPRRAPAGLDLAVLDAVLEAAWESKERTLRHGLAALAPRLSTSSGRVTEALRAHGWEAARPADLAPRDWAELARALQA